MQNGKPKKKTLWLVIGLAIAVLAAAAVGVIIMLMKQSGAAPSGGGQQAPAVPPTAYMHTGEVRALALAPPDPYSSADDLAAYFTEAANFAQNNGINTLLFQAKTGGQVWWRDDAFPAVDGIAMQDEGKTRHDPLAILTQVLAGRSIQLWLGVDAYGDAAPGDAAYEKKLRESLAALPQRYAVSGVVFTGFAGEGWLQADGPYEKAFSEMLAAFRVGESPAYSLMLGHDAGALRAEYTAALTAEGPADKLLPATGAEGDALANLAPYEALPAGTLVLTQPQNSLDGYFLFTAHTAPAFGGAVLAAWPQVAGHEAELALLGASLAQPGGQKLPAGFTIPQILGINYPAQNAKITTDGLFIMGTSDPAQPLLLDGEELETRAEGGAFGVGVELEVGENSFTFTQGDKSLTLHVERTGTAGGGSGGGGTGPAADTTLEAKPGQAVRMTALIVNALTDPDDDSAMNETFHRGAVAVVQESVQTWRGGQRTWAYKLTSGDYVLAKNCEWVDAGQTAFTGITVQAVEGGEELHFGGEGAPAAYIAYDNENPALVLTFYDTTLDLQENFSTGIVSGASVEAFDDHVVLRLNTPGLWGYSMEYHEGKTVLFLASPPALGANAGKPLEGVHVVVDPGHGDTDTGAAGVMGEGAGPNEKDMNLALATAISYRLRQLGATVTMTREGDSAHSLDERLEAQTLLRPHFFISVHHNSMPLTQDLNHIRGAQVYYYHPYNIPPSKQYAQNLIDKVAAATGRSGGDARWNYFYVTRTTVCPSVLFEYGFVINPEEFEDVTSTEGIRRAAYATAVGILATMPAA